MIANLIFFVLKSSLFILNLSIFMAIGCFKKQKSAVSNPSNSSKNEAVPPEEKVLKVSQLHIQKTEKEPAKTPSSDTQTPGNTPGSKAKSVSKKEKEAETLEVEKTQEGRSRETVRVPPRSREVLKLQKTLRDVQEVDAKGIVAGEKSANQDEFDDYLNKLGEKT